MTSYRRGTVNDLNMRVYSLKLCRKKHRSYCWVVSELDIHYIICHIH